jgi:hypothetical protein
MYLLASLADSDSRYGVFLSPGSGMGKKSRSGSGIRMGMNIPDHISESLKAIFRVKNTQKFFDADPYPGSRIFLTLNSGSGIEKF